MNSSPSHPVILWRQVSSLAIVQGAVVLCWVIYRLYVPQLLAGFGFPGLDRSIFILEDTLTILAEPITGAISDRQRQWVGTRFPLLALGAIASSTLFIAIPAIFIFGGSVSNPTGSTELANWRWILPVVLVIWALVMAILRSPVMSLLGEYAVTTNLPQAMSLLILVGGLAGAFKPAMSNHLLSMGPGAAFAIGSFVLLGAVAVLRAANPSATVLPPSPQTDTDRISLPRLALIAVMGVGVAWGTRVLWGDVLPKVLASGWPQFDRTLLSIGIGVALAFASLPAGILAVKVGNQRVTWAGSGVTAILLLVLALSQGGIVIAGLAIALIASYSLVANGTIPVALSLVPSHRGGLGIGMYFGGFSLGMTSYTLILGQPLELSLILRALVGVIAFLVTAFCVAFSDRIPLVNFAKTS